MASLFFLSTRIWWCVQKFSNFEICGYYLWNNMYMLFLFRTSFTFVAIAFWNWTLKFCANNTSEIKTEKKNENKRKLTFLVLGGIYTWYRKNLCVSTPNDGKPAIINVAIVRTKCFAISFFQFCLHYSHTHAHVWSKWSQKVYCDNKEEDIVRETRSDRKNFATSFCSSIKFCRYTTAYKKYVTMISIITWWLVTLKKKILNAILPSR